MKNEYLKILLINVIIFYCEKLYAHGLEIVVNTFIINFVFQLIAAFFIGLIIIILYKLIFNKRVNNKHIFIGSVLGSIISIIIYVLVLILIFDGMPELSFNFVITVSWIIFSIITVIGGFLGIFFKK